MSQVTSVRERRLRIDLQTLIHAILALPFLIVVAGWTTSPTPSAGEGVYRRGVLPSGKPLVGDRAASGSVEGEAAACVNCHRPSGLGTIEGSIVIPPVTAKYLFRARMRQSADTDHGGAAMPERNAYTDVTLMKAIREGIGPDGSTLNYLMPRYNLDENTMISLVAYLRRLSSAAVPGAADDTLHFATIVTPDSDPVKRRAMLEVLDHFFRAKNGFYQTRTPLPQISPRLRARAIRRWQLHVWELTGDSTTWKDQLRKHLAAEPVFAAISGIGGNNWAPVHDFCQEESLPCLLPNVELPVVRESDFYSIYFSRGVLLEADLISHRLNEQMGKARRGKLIQVYRANDVGVDASRRLSEDIKSTGFMTVNHALKTSDSINSLSELLEGAGPLDVCVFWLRPGDLKNLPAETVLRSTLYVSGLMGGLENSPLAGVFRNTVQITYPFELPARRVALLDYPLGWLRAQHIQIVAEPTQVDTYIACSILAQNIDSMNDNIVRDYLLEQIEAMLSSRIIDGYYSRLSLASGQRFASKGGYIVRFAGPGSTRLIAESDWLVP